MAVSNWTEAASNRAREIWSEYQSAHDVSGKIGQTAGIDPASGRIWIGDSIEDVVARRDADGCHAALYFVRIGTSAYYRKGGYMATKPGRGSFPLAIGLAVLVWIAQAWCSGPAATADDALPPAKAILGAELRPVTDEEAKAYDLAKIKVCVNGLYVATLVKDGPAAKAGLKEGDVLLVLDDLKLCSLDDVDDFVRVGREERKVRAVVKRGGTFKEEMLTVKLPPGKASDKDLFTWDCAGIEQLSVALAAARKEGKRVLVGLSGAET